MVCSRVLVSVCQHRSVLCPPTRSTKHWLPWRSILEQAHTDEQTRFILSVEKATQQYSRKVPHLLRSSSFLSRAPRTQYMDSGTVREPGPVTCLSLASPAPTEPTSWLRTTGRMSLKLTLNFKAEYVRGLR